MEAAAWRGAHLRGVVVGGCGTLRGRQTGGWDARDGALGGEGRGGVDEGWAVAERRAHQPRLSSNQLLVHLERHRGGGVGEAQGRAGGRGQRRRMANSPKCFKSEFTGPGLCLNNRSHLSIAADREDSEGECRRERERLCEIQRELMDCSG